MDHGFGGRTASKNHPTGENSDFSEMRLEPANFKLIAQRKGVQTWLKAQVWAAAHN